MSCSCTISYSSVQNYVAIEKRKHTIFAVLRITDPDALAVLIIVLRPAEFENLTLTPNRTDNQIDTFENFRIYLTEERKLTIKTARNIIDSTLREMFRDAVRRLSRTRLTSFPPDGGRGFTAFLRCCGDSTGFD
jgi:hypothetical protein